MIIDQLPLLDGNPQDADDFPIERGVTAYKTKFLTFATAVLAKLVKDARPTQDSTNPVESGGVYAAMREDLQSDDTPTMNGMASAGTSALLSRADHVHPTDTSRQGKITVSGMLKGAGDGNVVPATKGTDYGATVFNVTLPASGWVMETGGTDYAQSVSNDLFQAGYLYIISPAEASKSNFSGVFADDISTDGAMTFHSPTAKNVDLECIATRITSAVNKTVTVG